MAARLVFLGRLQDVAGCGEREVEPGALEAVLAALPTDLAAALRDPRIRVARNGTICDACGLMVGEGDEIAFLPPVSGG